MNEDYNVKDIAESILLDEDAFMQHVIVAAGDDITILALPTPSA